MPFPGGASARLEEEEEEEEERRRRDESNIIPPQKKSESEEKKDGFRGVREPRRRPDVLQRVAVFANRSDAHRVTDRRGRDAGEIDSEMRCYRTNRWCAKDVKEC